MQMYYLDITVKDYDVTKAESICNYLKISYSTIDMSEEHVFMGNPLLLSDQHIFSVGDMSDIAEDINSIIVEANESSCKVQIYLRPASAGRTFTFGEEDV